MTKLGGLREDRQLSLALKDHINQWLLVANNHTTNQADQVAQAASSIPLPKPH